MSTYGVQMLKIHESTVYCSLREMFLEMGCNFDLLASIISHIRSRFRLRMHN